MENPLRKLPSVNDLLETPVLKRVVEKVSHNVVVDNVRSFLDDARSRIKEKSGEMKLPTPTEMAQSIASWIYVADRPPLQPVINGTGVMLHTGLGRAPLADEAISAIAEVAAGYASVEVSLKTGKRSQRVEAVKRLLCEVTGAESAVVVNNNAAATLLTLAALAGQREVIVSRGELIEIGGSYRLPEVMSASGARLVEVGTTNKTRVADYENAMTEQTAAVMKVHTSNYVVCGFTEATTIQELVAVSRKNGWIAIDDVGSGALIDFSKYGLDHEPSVPGSIQAGADVVLFSGDKLVGGPQCGIIVGKERYIQQIMDHPMMRAMRVDKMTLAGLAATLRLYRKEGDAEARIPLLAMLSTSIPNLRSRGERVLPRIEASPLVESVELVEDHSMLGGGSVPTQTIPTICLQLTPTGVSVEQLAEKLRAGKLPVFGRIQNDQFLLDLRTVLPTQDLQLAECLSASESPVELDATV